MNQIRIAKIKPNYILNEGNFPSFLGNGTKTIKESANEFINNLFEGGISIEGSIQNYQTLSEVTLYLEVNNNTTYDIVFNSGYLEVTISNQKYYYFVNNVTWENDTLLGLNCHLDYWLTYWKELKWNPHGSCFLKRKLVDRYQVKEFNQTNYVYPVFNINNQIHNQDGQFNFENHIIQSLNNLEIEEGNVNLEPQFINQFKDNQVSNDLFTVFGVNYGGDVLNKINIMYYAFVAPNATSDLTFELRSIHEGVLPSGCFLVPIVTDAKATTTIPLSSGTDYHLSWNTYDKIANLGNGYVVSIVALPLAFHFWCFDEEHHKFTFESETINETTFFTIPNRFHKLALYPLITEDLSLKINGKFTYPLSDITYKSPHKFLNEPKLLDPEFTQFNLNISDKNVPLDNFNVLNFLANDSQIYLQPYLSFSLAPHLYTQIIRLRSNYLMHNTTNNFNTLNLAENGLFFQQDLQLISTSNAYNTFLTNHKNAFNNSLAQGKLGVKNAQYKGGSNFSKFFEGVSGAIKGFFGGGSSSSGGSGGFGGAVSGFKGGWNQGNRNIQGANLGLKGIQATAKDYKRVATEINDSNTSETYGFLTNQNFNYLSNIDNYQNLNVYAYISVYQIPFNQLQIVNNFYRLHGYLIENVINISSENFFRSRMYFDYFEIINLSANLIKTSGFNLEIIDWFNTMFEKGVRLWHSTELDSGFEEPQINDYQYNNWELLTSIPNQIIYKNYVEIGASRTYDIIRIGEILLLMTRFGENRAVWKRNERNFVRTNYSGQCLNFMFNSEYIFIVATIEPQPEPSHNVYIYKYFDNETNNFVNIEDDALVGTFTDGFYHNNNKLWVNYSTPVEGSSFFRKIINNQFVGDEVFVKGVSFHTGFSDGFNNYLAGFPDDGEDNWVLVKTDLEITTLGEIVTDIYPYSLHQNQDTIYYIDTGKLNVYHKLYSESVFTTLITFGFTFENISELVFNNDEIWFTVSIVNVGYQVYRFSNSTLTKIQDIGQLNVTLLPPNMFVDSQNNIWISTNQGVWLKKPSATFFTQPSELPNIENVSFYEADNEIYMIGLHGLWSAILTS